MIKRVTSLFNRIPMPGIYLVLPGRGGKEKKDIKPKSENELIIKDRPPLIIDTSALIDGRIADIVNTGFLSGTLVVTDGVLKELHRIADSKDSLKRNRGRRGLDVLNALKRSRYTKFTLLKTVGEKGDIDNILLTVAKKYKGRVITTDYNLNKVGKVMGVPILNINELANMVKTVMLPGEEFEITPLKEGKEKDQSVGYLPDGTMIVIKNGIDLIGKEIVVKVDRIYQTEAGKMIFVQPSPVK